VATATLALTDRLAIRIYVNVSGRTVTLHTENGHLCQVVTTLSKGMVSLNNLTDQSQFLAVGTSGTNFAIVSSGDTHTFNLPVASATNTGKLSSTDWNTFNNKQAALSFTAPLNNTSNTISIPAATSLVDGYLDNLDWTNFNTAYNNMIVSAAVTGTTTKTLTLTQQDAGTITASWTDDNTDAVTSVFGRTGAVVAQSGDYNTSQVTENTNLYFTDARSRAALSFSAGSGAYNSTTGVITIPTNNNQITNGSNFITLTSLSAGTGISYNNTTGVITNSAPDQTVSLTQGAGISISGTYPSFTIASTITQYTDALARAALSFVAGSGAYNSTTGVITIPTNNNQITNGAGYITSSALSGYLPLTGGTLTGALSGTSATFSGNGSFGTVDTTLTIGGVTNANTEGKVRLRTGSTKIAWEIGGQSLVDNALTITPSTAAGGTTFTTPILTIASTGAATFSSSVTANGIMSLGNDGTYGSNYKTLGLTGNTNGTHRIFAGTADNLYIAAATARGIEFWTDGSSATRMLISSGGNLLIGTTTDAGYKLDVNGTGRFKGLQQDAIQTIFTLYGYNAANQDKALYFRLTGSTPVWTLTTGAVGTDAGINIMPNGSAGLSLAYGGAATFSSSINAVSGNILIAPDGTYSGYSAIGFGGNVTDGAAKIFARNNATDALYICGPTGQGVTIRVNGTSEIAKFLSNGNTILANSGGNVGIGFSNVTSKLQVAGEITSYAGTNTSFYAYMNYLGITYNLGPGETSDNIDFKIAGGGTFASGGNFRFFTQPGSTTPIERMRITAGGNVLINTTTDAGYELYVNGGSTNGALFYSTSPANQIKAAGTAPAITFTNTITSPTIGGALGAATTANQFITGTAAGDVILLNQYSGNRLYVTSFSGGVYLTSGATSWTANSDIRLKNINSHIENAVEKLSTLQTINFCYKNDKTNKQNLGLIAQEVEKIFPELIDKDGEDMLGVRYTELVPVLIKAIQELKAEIDELKIKNK
jgi:hypothetical protein